MRLPRKIDLGLAVISIRLVSQAEMRDASDADDPSESPPDGFWDAESDSILIGRWIRSNKHKREIYFHEILHAINDSAYWSQH
jgi:hypothetical protein